MSGILAASLAPDPIALDVGGRIYTVPAYAADTWISALISDLNVWAVFPGLLEPEEREAVVDGLSDGTMSVADVQKAGFEAVRRASGRPWWEAMRMIGMADAPDGQLVGMLTLKGVNPCTMPLARWLSAVYAIAVQGRDEKELLQFQARLQAPPRGFEDAFEDGTQDDFAAMVRAARQLPGMTGNTP